MDIDDETMFATLIEEEAAIAFVDNGEHLIMLSFLMVLYGRDGAKPQ
jgi:hypothetical protein